MDYMAELAEHPDMHAALLLVKRELACPPSAPPSHVCDLLNKLVRDDPGTADASRPKRDLRTQHPHAWITEVIHAFYQEPQLAARAWKQLRYCNEFLTLTAERLLRERDVYWRRLAPTLPPSALKLVNEDLMAKWCDDGTRSAAIRELRDMLERDTKVVDDLCRHQPFRPRGAQFIEDVLLAERQTDPLADEAIMKFLGDLDLVRELAHKHKIAVPFSMVLDRELDQIWKTRERLGRTSKPDQPKRSHPLRSAIQANLVGLAFSGGGIRSATFNLGVLQAMARLGLLRECDYLSTVSGGGYIGSWFAAWLRRESYRRDRRPREAFDELMRRLSPTRSPNPMDAREKPLRYLREYSNYLTPRTGLMSADTWTMLGIYTRNALLNQVIILSLIAAALLAPRVWFSLVRLWPEYEGWAALYAFCVGGLFLTLNLRRLEPRIAAAELTEQGCPIASAERTRRWYATPAGIQLSVVAPWLLGAGLLAHGYAQRFLDRYCSWSLDRRPRLRCANLGLRSEESLCVLVGVFVVLAATLLFGRAHRSWLRDKTGRQAGMARLFAFSSILGSATVSAYLAAWLSWIGIEALAGITATRDGVLWHFTLLGPAALIAIVSLAMVVMLGVLGRHFPDEHREWWSRLRTFLHAWSILGATWAAASLYVPWAVHPLHMTSHKALIAIATWLGSTVFGLRSGQTTDSDDRTRNAELSVSSLPSVVGRWAAVAAPYACIIGLLVTVSLVIDAVYRSAMHGDSGIEYFTLATQTASLETAAVMLGLLAIGGFFSIRVDINEFSIHHFYRNRLVRCYLGASHDNRKADWFTGFDPRDDLPLCSFDNEFTSDPELHYPGPYPIINCALNLVGGKDLAWQERKATSFVFTPKYCGYDLDRAVLSKSDDRVLQSEAYVPTASYHSDEIGPPLGMAMAISGAAANPNMGRATTPASAFLMTVFNLRLGWWIKNPRRRKAMRPSPLFGLPYTSLELLGGTDDSGGYVNLSDGGHFDNLGVYELIRRGCRYIIVSDAGQDGSMLCEDLGNVVRKCRTDFGVEIEISVECIRERNASFSGTHCVVGKIHYLNIPRRNEDGVLLDEHNRPIYNGTKPAHEVGVLVYLKPSMTGDEPQDVQEYFRRVPEFPHQTTADQWFNESQFESYRKLGMHIAEETFGRYVQESASGMRDIKFLFTQLYRYWYPPDPSIGNRAGGHAQAYARILKQLQEHETLHTLDPSIFDGLPSLAAPLPHRDELYVCGALLNLMHDVYSDLDLERNWQHPHVEGWMRLFERWAKQPAFERAWRISESTYAKRFRSFYRDRVRRSTLPLPSSFRGRRYESCSREELEELLAGQAGVLLLTVGGGSEELVVERSRSSEASGSSNIQDLNRETLRACLQRLRMQAQLIIHISEEGTETAIFDCLKGEHWRLRDYVVISSSARSLYKFQEAAQNARLGLIVDFSQNEAIKPEVADALETGDIDFVAVAHGKLESSHIECARHLGRPLIVLDAEMDKTATFFAYECVAGVVAKQPPAHDDEHLGLGSTG